MPLADRRLASRFEIVGGQWGILDALEPLRVRDVSAEGMLLESPNPLAVGSIHEFQLIGGATAVRVHAAVRHVSPQRHSTIDRYFLVGLEFLNLGSRSSMAIERWRMAQPTRRRPDMDYAFTERRASPRASTESAALGALHVSVPVRLLDIGSDGMLIGCWVPLRVGSTVRVVAGVAGRRMEVEIIVRHVSGGWDEQAGGYVVGGSFPSVDAAARQVITALIGASGLGAAADAIPLAARSRPEAPIHGGVRRGRSARRPATEHRPEQPRPEQPSWSVPAS